MGRSGYSDDLDSTALAMWRGRVASATRGKRGQAFLRDLLAALDAMPEKRLIANELVADGEVCAIGSVGVLRGVDMQNLDPYDADAVGAAFNIAPCLAQEVMFENDDDFSYAIIGETPEHRWERVRAWVAKQIKE